MKNKLITSILIILCYGNCVTLHEAAEKGELGVVKDLLEDGADVNKQDKKGKTALHYAATEGHSKIVRILIVKKGDVNVKDQNGETPLHFASYKGYLGIVETMVENGANINVKGINGFTPLHYALAHKDSEITRYLIEKGADINAKLSHNEYTALHLASQYDNTKAIIILVEKGADVNVKNKNGDTPLHVASKTFGIGSNTVSTGRVSYNEFTGEKYYETSTSTYVYNRLAAVKLLVEKGADTNAKNNDNKTPLDLATSMKNIEVISFLSNIKREK